MKTERELASKERERERVSESTPHVCFGFVDWAPALKYSGLFFVDTFELW